MNKKIITSRLLLPFSLTAGIFLSGCGSSGANKDATPDSAVETQAPESSTKGEYASVSLNDENEVREFIHFKKFVNGQSVIGFNRKGGYLDGEKFDITSIKVISPAEADISISVPSVKISGTLQLQIHPDSVMLHDLEANTSYKLAQ